jgi:tRNA A37 threonylcarbamoyladenosine dehydratase
VDGDDNANSNSNSNKGDNSSAAAYPDEIRNEIFSRVRTVFGDDEYANLQRRFVVVVGLGGVGSHAAHMLVRSGVARMRLIDFDQVTLSSLNRHAVASMEDVGLSKAEAMRRKLLKIVPWCQIEAVTEMFRQEAADALLAGSPDFVLDCIDDVSTKAELIAYCVKRDITVLTSMGAGGKADPTRLRISALSDCTHDPLATKIKWKLKKHGVLPEQVMSVFSVEQPMVDLLPLEEEGGAIGGLKLGRVVEARVTSGAATCTPSLRVWRARLILKSGGCCLPM